MLTTKKKSQVSSTLGDKYYFDAEAAQRPIDFTVEFCTHVKGELAGQPIVPLQWEIDRIYKPLYGVKQKENGCRRYKRVYIQVGRKNNKSTNIACLNLYNLFGFDIIGYEGHVLASSRDQASILFNEIIKPMILANKTLSSACEIYSRHIIRPRTRGKLQVHASDGPKLHGHNADTVSIDEIWALMTEKGKEAIAAVNTSVASKNEPITFMFGTPGYDRTSEAFKMYEYSKKVLNGEIIDDTLLPVIFEANEDDDPFVIETWKKANPGFGHTVKEHYLREEANKAKQYPSALNIFKRLHLGIWTKSEQVWIPAHVWNANTVNKKPIEDFRGRSCFIGIDLANYHDLLPVALVFPNKDGETIDVILEYWVTYDKASDRKTRNEADYFAWNDQGYVNITPGNVADYQIIRKRIGEYSSVYGIDIKVIGYDDWNASQFAQDLASDGANINPWSPSNAKLWNAPTKKMEAMATAGQINHMGNPVLAWNVENTVIRYNGEYIKPDKGKSKDKIDGVIATIIAIGEWMNYVPEPPKSHGLGL